MKVKGTTIYFNLLEAVGAIKKAEKAVRFDASDLHEPLRRHHAFIERKDGMRFKDGRESRVLKAWGFDLIKLANEYSAPEEETESKL